MSDLLQKYGITFSNMVDHTNSIAKDAEGERRICQFLSGIPLVKEVERIITIIDECINGIPPDNAGLNVYFIACEIDFTGVKMWYERDFPNGPYESYTLEEFMNVLLLWKEFVQTPPTNGTKKT